MPLSPGSILYHRYRIVKLLGQGGFGAVYRAWDISLEKPCAIKENLVSDEAAQRQFKREAVLLANLTHPNLPRVSDHFIISDQGQYLVMDFIDGENLEELQLRNQGALPEALVLYWIGQICDALSYLHEQGVIHRDVKPANIRIASMKRGMDRAMQAGVLFDPLTAAFDETRPYLVDFGIAKSGGGSAGAQATTIGARAVTPGFSPLEQYGGQGHTDERSDIFALGATIYCLLTGSTPPDIVDVMARISQPAIEARKVNPLISEQTSAAVLRAMSTERELRWDSVVAFKEALLLKTTTTVTPTQPAEFKVQLIEKPEIIRTHPVQLDQPRVVQTQVVPASLPAQKPTKYWKWILLAAIVACGILAISIMAYLSYRSLLQTPSVAQITQSTPTRFVATPTSFIQASAPTETKENPHFLCIDPLRCVDIHPQEPIHIAAALVIAGPNETLGLDSLYGVEIAVADKGGKLLGHDIKLSAEDTGCSAETGQAAATRLAADATILGIIGTSCSSEARVAMPLFSKAGFSVVSPSNTAPDLTEAGNANNFPGYLRTAHNDKIQGAAAAKFALEKLGLKKAATIHDGSLYADKLQQVFAEEFKNLGGEITAQEAVDPNQTDMGPVLTRIATGAPELVYFPVFLPAGGFIIQQAKQTSGLESTYLMGADGLFSPDVVKAAGDAADGFFVSSPFLEGADYDVFKEKYKAKYGKEPISIFHAHAYDAANMIMTCIEKMATKDDDGTMHVGRQALRDCLYDTKEFQGLTGVLTCTATGDCANPTIAVYQYKAGEYPPAKIWP